MGRCVRFLSPIRIALVALVALVDCGGARQPANAPPMEPEPTTIEEAQSQIERASATLGTRVQTEGHGGAAGGTESAPPPESPARVAAEPDSSSEREIESTSQESPCAGACRALQSMRRATTVLCRLAGAEDARCTDAKRTLAASEERVRVQGCSC